MLVNLIPSQKDCANHVRIWTGPPISELDKRCGGSNHYVLIHELFPILPVLGILKNRKSYKSHIRFSIEIDNGQLLSIEF